MRVRTWSVGLAAAAFLSLLVGPIAASNEEIPPILRGRVVVSDVLIAPASEFASRELMLAALRRFERSVVEGSGGFWRFHLVAFLDRSRDPADSATADTGTLRMLVTDVTDAKDRHDVKVFEFTGAPGAHELRVKDLVVTAAMGFAAGRKYELAVTRGWEPIEPAGVRKQDAYARGVVTLR